MGKKRYIEIEKIVWHNVLITATLFVGAIAILCNLIYIYQFEIACIDFTTINFLTGFEAVCIGLAFSGLLSMAFLDYEKTERVYIEEEDE